MKTAEDYIKIFCDYFEANTRNLEIAQECPHVMGKLVDFCGELPGGSGFFHDTLMPKIDKMKKIPAIYNKAKELFLILSHKQQYAVFMWEYYIHRRISINDKNLYLASGKDVAMFLEVDYMCFRKNRQRGLDRMNAKLGVLVA